MMNWKRSTTLIVSLLTLIPIYKIVQACSDIGDPYDSYTSFFPPQVSSNPAYTPFYYQAWMKYYNEWYDAPPIEGATDGNIEEWYAYAGQSVPRPDLDSFIYRYSYADLKNLYYHLEKNEPLALSNKAIQSNGFTKWFTAGKDLEALGYLMYAKQCEPYVNAGDNWNAPVKIDTGKISRLIKNGIQLHAAAKKDLMKDKYAFQVIRLAFYAERPKQAVELFSQLIGERNSGGYTYARCLELKAGGLFRQKLKTEAAYYYSKVFDLNNNLKSSSYMSFDWSVGNDVSGVLKLCKTPHERAVVHVMDGLHNYEYGLPVMQAAYEADPSVDGLDVLMTREINKVEERYQHAVLEQRRNLSASTGYYVYYYDATGNNTDDKRKEVKNKYEKYLGLLNAFAQKAAADNKRSRSFWLLSSAYLYFIQEDVPAYKKQLAAAGAEKMSGRERDLYDVLQVLYAIRSNGSNITPSVEAQLLPQLKALKKRSDQKAFRDVMGMVLTTTYLQQHDTVKALFALAGSTLYISEDYTDLPGSILERMTPDKLQEVKAFVQKSNKSEYERWLLDSNHYTISRLQELEGTKYLRQHQFEKAAAVLAQADETVQLPNPFVASLQDTQDLTGEDTSKFYSKKEFAQKMLALEQKIKKSPNDADALFEYATGLYSMTYYGKAYSAYTYYRSSVDGYGYFNSPDRKALPDYARDYYGATTAEQYYRQAATLATGAEMKAKCLFMAAKCWQKRADATAQFSEYRDQDAYFAYAMKNPYFRQLKDNYTGTAFYKEAYATCAYLNTYISRNK